MTHPDFNLELGVSFSAEPDVMSHVLCNANKKLRSNCKFRSEYLTWNKSRVTIINGIIKWINIIYLDSLIVHIVNLFLSNYSN